MKNVVRLNANPDARNFDVQSHLDNIQDDIESQDPNNKKKKKKKSKKSKNKDGVNDGESEAPTKYTLPQDNEEDDLEKEIRNVENRMDGNDNGSEKDSERIRRMSISKVGVNDILGKLGKEGGLGGGAPAFGGSSAAQKMLDGFKKGLANRFVSLKDQLH
jgi:hypothetical protein